MSDQPDRPEDPRPPDGRELPHGHELPDSSELPHGNEVPDGTELPDSSELPDGTEVPDGRKLPEGNDADASVTPEDEALEAELRRLAARDDPVPDLVLRAAMDAFSWRDLDSELAELVFDSLLDADPATLVRSSPGRRLVSFRTPAVSIDLEVTSTGSGREVMGQITPPERASVQIRHREGQVTLDADELGRFMSAALRPGPISLRLVSAADGERPAVVTDWVSI